MRKALQLSPRIWRDIAVAVSLTSISLITPDSASGQTYPKDPVHYFVTGAYQGILGRQPDAAGWMFWVGPNDNLAGLTQANVSNYFMTSAEYCGYFNLQPSQCPGSSTTTTNPPTDPQFLSLLYSRALNEPNASSTDQTYLAEQYPYIHARRGRRRVYRAHPEWAAIAIRQVVWGLRQFLLRGVCVAIQFHEFRDYVGPARQHHRNVREQRLWER